MDGAIFQGRLLHVLPAHRPPPPRQATEVRGAMPSHALAKLQYSDYPVTVMVQTLDCMASWSIQAATLYTVQDADSAGKGDKGFKAVKEAERRASAGNRSAWNTLFMRPDTVAAAIAEHYGVSRAELLDRDAAGDTASTAAVYLIPYCMRPLAGSRGEMCALQSFRDSL